MTLTRADIEATYRLIHSYIRRTPVLEIESGDLGIEEARLALKLELFQHSGSFKTRGAFTNLLLRKVPPAGVVAASGGNHGAAVAYAAMQLNVPAKIFVPIVASPSKIERIRSYRAELVVTGERYSDALLESEKWIAESGAMSIHAYDAEETLLGQGTVALEFEQQAPHLDTLLVAVGGGGLIGGTAIWYSGSVKLIGVEPETAPTLKHALLAGHPVDAPAGGIAADSLAPKQVGNLMFPIAKERVDRVVLVTDEAILQAQEFLWDKLRLVTEPGGAAAFAAVLSKQYVPAANERVGIIVCGGNTTAVRFTSNGGNNVRVR